MSMKPMWRVTRVQSLVLMIAFVIAWSGFGWINARSVLMGGLIVLIPHLLLTLRMSLVPARSPASLVTRFFVGEFAKLGLTLALLIAVAFGMKPVWPALMIGMVICLKSVWISLALESREPNIVTQESSEPR